jgi:hypothetical protein
MERQAIRGQHVLANTEQDDGVIGCNGVELPAGREAVPGEIGLHQIVSANPCSLGQRLRPLTDRLERAGNIRRVQFEVVDQQHALDCRAREMRVSVDEARQHGPGAH